MQELNHSQFLDLLKQRGIQVLVKDGRLQISAPAGAVDLQLRAELVRRKPDLLGMLQGVDVFQRADPLVPMERTEKIPQTYAQQGLWLIDHFSPGNVAYNIPEAFLIEGEVHTQLLQKAVDGLLARHETLRTSFYEEEGELFQAVSPNAELTIGFTDLSVLAEDGREQTLKKLIQEQARQPFDLSRPPLVRFHLFRLAEQRHVIFFNIHHIIADRGSLNILRQELTTLYQAAVRNEPVLLPNMPVQYADYAIWSSRRLADGTMAAQIQYWKKKLGGAPPFLELPSSRPYPEERTSWGATVPIAIPASLRSALTEMSRQESATMFMMLLAAFFVLLLKYSGQEDFSIGSPFTHRNQIETEPIIGLFVNMLTFRCDLSGEPTYRELVTRIRTTALEAYENSDVPFQILVRELKPDPRSLRSPLFQVMFGFDSNTGSDGPGLVQIDTNPGTAKFDLTLQLSESPDNITGTLEYCTDLFDAPDMERMAAQFVGLLEQLASNPDQPITAIKLEDFAQMESAATPEVLQPEPVSTGGIRTLVQRFWRRSASKVYLLCCGFSLMLVPSLFALPA